MKTKFTVAWIIETLVDCGLISTLLWVTKTITINNIIIHVASLLAGMGILLLIINFILYTRILNFLARKRTEDGYYY